MELQRLIKFSLASLLLAVIPVFGAPVGAFSADDDAPGAVSWGINTYGQLGDGSADDKLVPVAVDKAGFTAGAKITDVSAGVSHACAVVSGKAYCWGNNDDGQLGNGTTDSSEVPVAVNTTGALAGATVTKIRAGGAHTCALADGKAFCWGSNDHGQLGQLAFAESSVPGLVDEIDGKKVTEVSAGFTHTCAIAGGEAFCWGDNGRGQLGNGSTFSSNTPVAVRPNGLWSAGTVTAISAGGIHSCAIAGGKAFCWGNNENGRLGNDSSEESLVPVAVTNVGLPEGQAFSSISAGGLHTCAVYGGSAYCWGSNLRGQLGSGSEDFSTQTPVAVDTSGVLLDKTVSSISAGYLHTCAIAFGNAYCWGGNSGMAMLGDNSLDSSNVPVAVVPTGALAGKIVTKISAGTFFTIANAVIPKLEVSEVPTLSGDLAIGQSLVVDPGTWTEGTTLTYQWYRGSTLIPGATESEYELTKADVNSTIKAKVTGSLPQGVPPSLEVLTAPTKKLLLSSRPVVSGSMSVGSTLSSSFAKNSWTSSTKIYYQWLRDGAPISKATSSKYKLTKTDDGKSITLKVTGKKTGYGDAVQYSVAREKVMLASSPKITGTVNVGRTLEVNAGQWSAGTNFTYHWLRGGVPIPAATGSTYEVGVLDAGYPISVRVTGEKADFTTITKLSSATSKVLKSAEPTITGSFAVGSTLGVAKGTWTPKVSFSYQWLRDGQPIKKATKSTYKLTSSDANKVITVRVKGKRSGYATVLTTSASGSKVIVASTPKVSGSLVVGEELSANLGSWSVGTNFSYEWYRSGVKIDGATGSSYAIRSADVDKAITVKVTGSLTDYSTTSRTSAATAKVMASSQPSITGDVVVGSTLGVNRGVWSAKVVFSYQWFRDGKAISNATKSTYKLTTTDMGKVITVRVTGKRSGYGTVALTSAPVPR